MRRRTIEPNFTDESCVLDSFLESENLVFSLMHNLRVKTYPNAHITELTDNLFLN